MTTLHLRKSIGRSPLRLVFLLVGLALGWFAFSPLARAVDPPPDGGYPNANTAEGDNALLDLGLGAFNTAIGNSALQSNTTGSQNTATGALALQSNTTAGNNTATGSHALVTNTTGYVNTATGAFALFSNTTGYYNTATGYNALLSNTTGFNNTTSGAQALFSNTIGRDNTANGLNALYGNTNGVNNTATGSGALQRNTSGGNNIGLGFGAGANLTTGSNNIDIGAAGVAGEAGKIRIGRQGTQNSTFIAGIYNMSEGGTIKPVYINSAGRLGTQPPASSRRFKTKIKPMDKSSEALLALKPVTFHYKNYEQSTAQFGLIAEEVAKVSPELVVRDDDGEIYTVRYEAVNAMLLNEFLKEHRKVQEQEATIAELKSTIAQQQKRMEAVIARLDLQGAQIQKVSAQIEVSKPAPQMVANDQ